MFFGNLAWRAPFLHYRMSITITSAHLSKKIDSSHNFADLKEQMEKLLGHKDHSQRNLSARKKRILIVDDSADLLELNRTLLEMEDYEVFTAQSGGAALSLLAEVAQPDLILLDVRMEDMSGPAFLLMLEKNRPDILENVPVVFLSALDKVPESKAVGFIRKPYDFEKFLEAIRRFIEMGVEHPQQKDLDH